MGYISSNANRFYVGLENSFGQTPVVTPANRIPALKLKVRQQFDTPERRDKTGSRTYAGAPAGGRRQTAYELATYMSTWPLGSSAPAYGPLFHAALGRPPLLCGGGTAAAGCSGSTMQFAAPHGLVKRQAVAYGAEIRFVQSVTSDTAVELNAPFMVAPLPGAQFSATLTYLPATEVPSVSIFDYWAPEGAVQRILCGAAVDKCGLKVNGAYHEFQFSGTAKDAIDSASFAAGEGQLASFPAEPAAGAFDAALVPGNMGQAWIGGANRLFTITDAAVTVGNGIEARGNEFGSATPRGISPGMRSVTAVLQLYAQDDEGTRSLHSAARRRETVSLMVQLGEQTRQMCGVYLPALMLQPPEFEDGDARLQWKFREARAQGAADDEVAVAFA